MLGSLGVPEILLIFAVVLIVFGPRRIPEIGRTLGKFMAEFRKATDDFKGTIEREVRLEELKKLTPDITTPYESISRSEPETPLETATSEVEPVTVADAAPVASDSFSDTPGDSAGAAAEPATPRADVTHG